MGETGVPAAMPSPQRGSYIARHWRGELSLPKSYWLNGVLLWAIAYDLAITILAGVALTLVSDHAEPATKIYIDGQYAGGYGLSGNGAALAWTIAGVYIALQLVAYVWALVGTWRSAGNYKGPAVWKVLARVAMVLGVLVSAVNITRTLTNVEHLTEAAMQTRIAAPMAQAGLPLTQTDEAI